MSVILVPYHLDEYLPDLDFPLAEDLEVTTVVEELPDGDLWARLGRLYEPLVDAVERTARKGAMATVLSGDCVVPLGTMAGLQRAGVDASIVWFDGHGDVQTLETTTSGYLGGMTLRMLVGYRPELMAERLGLRTVAEDRVVLVDARDLDPVEVEYLAASGIRRCPVDGLSAGLLPAGPLLLHVDLDVVNPGELPGLRFPAPGGPPASAVLDAARRVLETGRVVAVVVGCTWHSGHGDPSGVRSRLVSGLVADG